MQFPISPPPENKLDTQYKNEGDSVESKEPIQMSPQQFEQVQEKANELKKEMETKATEENVRILQNAKLEDPSDVEVITKTIPVAVGAMYGGCGIALNYTIVGGIIVLLYVLWALNQPSLSGTWESKNNKLTITHNRLTGNVKLDCTCFSNPQHGYVNKNGIIFLNSTEPEFRIDKNGEFGTWNHKDLILSDYGLFKKN